MTPADVVVAARKWIGTPWAHQGRTPGVALDCAGLVICVARELGVVPEGWDVNGYGRTPDGTLLQWFDQMLPRAPLAALQPGDVIAVAIEHDAQHIGIIADWRHGGLSVIHAGARAGRVIETRLVWLKNFKPRGAWRMIGGGRNG